MMTFYPAKHRRYDVQAYLAQFGFSVCSRDVTERMHADHARRQSEKRYRSLFEPIDEGFSIIEMMQAGNGLVRDYQFCETDAAFEKQNKLRNAEGKIMRQPAPGIEERWFDIFGKAASTGEPIRFESESEFIGR